MPGSGLTVISGRPLTTAYVEHASLFILDGTAVCQNTEATVGLPSLRLLLLLIGPGCSITSATIRQLTADGTAIGWTSTSMAKLQAVVYERNRRSSWLCQQARVSSVPRQRLAAARRLWRLAGGHPGGSWGVAQIRAADSLRMRNAYREGALRYGLEWKTRVYRPAPDDPLNIALNISASTLYSALCAGVVALGLEPGLGVLHEETHMAFVFDLAEIWRVSVIVEASMLAASELPLSSQPIIPLAQTKALELIAQEKVLEQLPKACQAILAIS